MNKEFEIRPTPRVGTVLRVRLSDGYYYYVCQVSSTRQWLYTFRTADPAYGSEFFDRRYWRWGLKVAKLAARFVHCGYLKLEGFPYTYTPILYKTISPEEAKRRGFRHNTVIRKSWNSDETREVTPEEIHRMGYGLDRWMEGDYEEIIFQYLPQMHVREVPAKFLDKRDPASLIKTLKIPKILTVRVTFREADLATEDPELDIEEPLQEAVENAECGEWVSSGTERGGLFSIDIETSTSTRSKCLKVIQRTLKKLGCPESTTIEVLEQG